MVAWFGGTLCLLALNVVVARAGSLPELLITDQNLHMLDETFIKFPALGTLITGLLLAVLTNWGLTNYYWIITKEVLTIAIIAFGIFGMNRWTSETSSLLASQGWEALQVPFYAVNRSRVLNGAIINSLGMGFIVLVTYLKPWGKRKRHSDVRKSPKDAFNPEQVNG